MTKFLDPTETLYVSETGGTKGMKLARFDLIPPLALWDLAVHYGIGAQKYEDHNWTRGYPWSLSISSLHRHLNKFQQGEDIDPESGTPHIVAASWHAFTLMTFRHTHPEFDDRMPYANAKH